MNTIFVVTSVAFFIWTLRNTLFWVSLWQTKEYRLDRMFVHLTETHQGRMLLFSPLNLFKFLLFFSYASVLLSEQAILPYNIIVMGVYLYEVLLFIIALITRKVKRPVITGKTVLLVVLSLLTILGLYTLGIIQQGFLWMLILDKITVLVITFFVFSLSVPTMLFQDYKVDLAIKKRQSLKNLRVIGITGSYGKSSTKEYIAQILSTKFNVAKTHGTNNTPIGLANTVLSKVTKQTQIFVAEMGAYKRGEIAELCQIAQPHIGVLTAVASQHLSLFGSRENVAKAKFELIQSLPADGLGLFNSDDNGSLELSKKTKRKKVLYGLDTIIHEQKRIDTITASKIQMKKDSLSFTVHFGKKQFQCHAPLIGKHAIQNMLPGIYLGYMFGMNEQEIKQAVSSLTPLPKTMVVHTSAKGVALVDDTFNINPQAVIAAMVYASLYKGKKILVLEPMIELGSDAKKEHYRVGKTLADTCDHIFMTKKNFYADVVRGVTDKKGTCKVEVLSVSKIVSFINANIKKQDVVVFEGKEAALVLSKIV